MTPAVRQTVEDFKLFCRLNDGLIMGEVAPLKSDPHCIVIQIYDVKPRGGPSSLEYHVKICALEPNDDEDNGHYLVAVYCDGRQVEYVSCTEENVSNRTRSLTGSIISEKSKRRIECTVPKPKKRK